MDMLVNAPQYYLMFVLKEKTMFSVAPSRITRSKYVYLSM